jgi:hypothetical protein
MLCYSVVRHGTALLELDVSLVAEFTKAFLRVSSGLAPFDIPCGVFYADGETLIVTFVFLFDKILRKKTPTN